MKKINSLLFCIAPMALAISSVVHADEPSNKTLEEVIVTAEKRTTDLQDTGIAISTVSGDEAVKKGLMNMADMLKDMIGVNIQDVGDGTTVNIRGMGYDLPTDVGEGAVSISYDGAVNSAAQSSIFGFYDLERMEVLRGPQGTLYGRNATGGAVNVMSTNPTSDEVKGYALVEAGNYSHRRLEGAINIPMSDTQAMRVSFSDVDRDGYMSTGSGDVDGTAYRVKYAYTPNDDTRLILSYENNELGGISQDLNAVVSEFDAGNPYVSDRVDPNQSYEFEMDRYTANFETKLGDGILTLITSRADSVRGGTMFFPPAGGLIDQGVDETEQESTEVRYASLPESDVQWVIGAYYYDREQEKILPFGPCGGEGCMFGAGSQAVFGQVTVPMGEDLRIIAGLRYSDDESRLAQRSGPPGNPFENVTASFKNTTWKVGLEKDFSDDVMMYATVATGTRPGGFNTGVNIDSTTFDEEEVTSYEIGVKSRLMEDRLQINGALFRYDYENYQTVDAAGSPFIDPASFYVQFFNAATAEITGLELETLALLSDTTRLNFGIAYLDAVYTSDFVLHKDLGLGPFVAPEPVLLKNATLPRSPEFTIKMGLDHDFIIGDSGVLTASANVRWLDDHKGAAIPTPVTEIDAYSVLDLNASYTPNEGDWSANLWVKNASDKIYKLNASTNAIIAGPPRMAGVSVRYNF